MIEYEDERWFVINIMNQEFIELKENLKAIAKIHGKNKFICAKESDSGKLKF